MIVKRISSLVSSSAALIVSASLCSTAEIPRHTIQTAVNGQGITEVTLVNTSNVPITAIHVTFLCSPYPAEISLDALVEGTVNGSIPSQGTFRYEIPPLAAACPGGIEDIAYADGVHEGSVIGRERTINRRRAVYDEVTKVKAWIQAIPASEWNSARYLSFAIARQEQLKNDQVMPKTKAFDEKQVRMEAMSALIRRIQGIDPPHNQAILTQEQALRIMNKWVNVLGDALKLDGVVEASSNETTSYVF